MYYRALRTSLRIPASPISRLTDFGLYPENAPGNTESQGTLPPRRARANGVVSLSSQLFVATVVSEIAYAAFFLPCEVVLRLAVAVPAMP